MGTEFHSNTGFTLDADVPKSGGTFVAWMAAIGTQRAAIVICSILCASHELIKFNKTLQIDSAISFFVGIYIVVGIKKQYETHMNQRLLGKTGR